MGRSPSRAAASSHSRRPAFSHPARAWWNPSALRRTRTRLNAHTMPPTFICGDIHGQYDKLVRVLRENGLIRETLAWNGGDAQLWFMGDFVDRGEDGIPAVDLVMRLQREAEAAGGAVHALMGNHELLFLSAYHFGKRGGFRQAWLR
ncbi:MAG: hypothetical protein CUN53_07835, partial [Phototrophicales bacterium]